MANEKVTALPTVVSAALTDIIYAVQGGLSVQETLQQVANLMLSNTVLFNAGNPNGSVAGTTFQLLWDTTNVELWICTTSGSAVTAVWTLVASSTATIVNPAHGGTGVASPTAHTLPVAEGASNFNFLGPLTNGQVLIGSTGADPVAASISAGSGITVTPGAGSITISSSGGGLNWTEVTSATQTIAVNTGYIVNRGGGVAFSLPATMVQGGTFAIVGKIGAWSITAGGGQTIGVGSTVSSAGGSISSANALDSGQWVCTTANTVWNSIGGPQTAGFVIV